MWLHSISDLITNSSTVVYIYPYDNAIEQTKKLLISLLPNVAIDDYKFYLQINESWFQLAFDYEIKIAGDFLTTKHLTFDDYFELESNDAEELLAEFTKNVKQQWEDGTLPFEFAWDDINEKDWSRWVDIVIVPPTGEPVVLNDMICDIFGLGYQEPQ